MHGARAIAESSHLICKLQAGSEASLAWIFETLKPAPDDTPPLTRPHLLTVPPTGDQNIQIYEPMGPVLIQSATEGVSKFCGNMFQWAVYLFKTGHVPGREAGRLAEGNDPLSTLSLQPGADWDHSGWWRRPECRTALIEIGSRYDLAWNVNIWWQTCYFFKIVSRHGSPCLHWPSASPPQLLR